MNLLARISPKEISGANGKFLHLVWENLLGFCI